MMMTCAPMGIYTLAGSFDFQALMPQISPYNPCQTGPCSYLHLASSSYMSVYNHSLLIVPFNSWAALIAGIHRHSLPVFTSIAALIAGIYSALIRQPDPCMAHSGDRRCAFHLSISR